MKKEIILSQIFFLLLLNIASFAQTNSVIGSAEWLVHSYFVENTFPNKVNYFSGEMLKQKEFPTIGEELKGTAKVVLKQLEQNNSSAVFAISIAKSDNSKDFYCFLKK